MKKTKKQMEDFLFDETEMMYLEKALYALTDKIKEERLEKKIDVKQELEIGKIIDRCYKKLKLHNNFFINRNIYKIIVSEDEVVSHS